MHVHIHTYTMMESYRHCGGGHFTDIVEVVTLPPMQIYHYFASYTTGLHPRFKEKTVPFKSKLHTYV